MPRRFSREARTFLLEMVFYAGLGVFAWLYPKTYAKVFLQIEVAILTVLVFVVLVLLRMSREQRRARRVRQRESSVVIPIRD
jgi:uncharacterized membrane protein YeiB